MSGKFRRECGQEITRLCEQHGVAVQIDYDREHPQILLEKNGRKRVAHMSGSPSDSDALRIKLGDIRRLFREEGWMVAEDQQSMAEALSALGKVTVNGHATEPSPVPPPPPPPVRNLHGVPIPEIPRIARGEVQRSAWRDPDYAAFLKVRTQFAIDARQAGAEWVEIAGALRNAGHIVTPSALTQSVMKNGGAPTPRAKPTAWQSPEMAMEETQILAAIGALVEQLVIRRTVDLQREVTMLRKDAEEWKVIRELIAKPMVSQR